MFIEPLTQDEVRRGRRLQRGEIAQDGDYIGFELALMDSAPPRRSASLADSSSDALDSQRALRDLVRDAQYHPQPRPLNADRVARQPSYSGSASTAESNAAVRDLARRSQFGG